MTSSEPSEPRGVLLIVCLHRRPRSMRLLIWHIYSVVPLDLTPAIAPSAMSSALEKNEASIKEAGLTVVDDAAEHATLCPEARSKGERRLKRKLDLRLMSTVVAICLMNYIDVSCAASS